MEANPHHPRRYELILGVNEYRLVRCRRTVDEVVRASQGGSLWTSVVLAAAHRRMGDRAAVGDALRGRIARGNGVARSARELHAKWFDPPLVEHLVDGLSKAGLGDAGVIPQGGHRARGPETPACRTRKRAVRTLRPAVLLLAPALLLAALAASAAAPQPPKRSDPIRLALQKGDPDAAVTAADAALKSFPKDTDVLLWAGRAYFSGEDLEKGVSCFERYLTLPVPEDGPTHADARWRKGLLLEKLGKTPAAIAEYRETPKADPATGAPGGSSSG